MPPEILTLEFAEDLLLSLLVAGNAPPDGELVKYQLFNADDMTLLADSGWNPWTAPGYTFEGVDAYTSYAIRYGFDNGEWTFLQARHQNEYTFTSSDLILSMIQLHTQTRSERIGRTQEFEVYHNTSFDRSGGGI